MKDVMVIVPICGLAVLHPVFRDYYEIQWPDGLPDPRRAESIDRWLDDEGWLDLMWGNV